MPIGTAVHDRTLALCESLNYREWSGYFAVSSYEVHFHHEYNAIRNAAALIDISPLFKYRLSGPDARRPSGTSGAMVRIAKRRFEMRRQSREGRGRTQLPGDPFFRNGTRTRTRPAHGPSTRRAP